LTHAACNGTSIPHSPSLVSCHCLSDAVFTSCAFILKCEPYTCFIFAIVCFEDIFCEIGTASTASLLTSSIYGCILTEQKTTFLLQSNIPATSVFILRSTGIKDTEGNGEGCGEGGLLGASVGLMLGFPVGATDGLPDGADVGFPEGAADFAFDGAALMVGLPVTDETSV